MSHLFSPMTIVRKRLPNRIVMGTVASGYALPDGFIGDDLLNYYVRRAHGGVGLIITEPLRVVPPDTSQVHAHVGLYHDAFVPRLRSLVQAVHEQGTRLIVALDEPTERANGSMQELHTVSEQFIRAAWRVLAAGCDGIMLSSADGGVLHQLISQRYNQPFDGYGALLNDRLWLPLHIVGDIRAWLGTRLIIGFRFVAEDFMPGGIALHDARLIARRLVMAGVMLLDVTTDTFNSSAPVARFPGWRVPLAESIKRVMPDSPIICSGLLGEPYLADSVIREGFADLVMLRHALHITPDWPRIAQEILSSQEMGW